MPQVQDWTLNGGRDEKRASERPDACRAGDLPQLQRYVGAVHKERRARGSRAQRGLGAELLLWALEQALR